MENNLIPIEYIIGKNYHVIWQSHRAMRFKLMSISGNKGLLQTKSGFKGWCKLSDLRNTNKNHKEQLQKEKLIKNEKK